MSIVSSQVFLCVLWLAKWLYIIVSCPAGYYGSETDQTGCKKCNSNSYNSEDGHRTCNECPEGMGTFIQGASSVSQCFRKIVWLTLR